MLSNICTLSPPYVIVVILHSTHHSTQSLHMMVLTLSSALQLLVAVTRGGHHWLHEAMTHQRSRPQRLHLYQ